MSKRKIVSINDESTMPSQRKREVVTESSGDNRNSIIDLCESENDSNGDGSDDDYDDDDVIMISSGGGNENNHHMTSSSSSNKKDGTSKKSVMKTSSVVSTKSKSSSKSSCAKYKIFCDLDGVLVDFEKGALNLFQNNKYKSVSSIPPRILWPRISSSQNFFSNLSWTEDGEELWQTLLFHLEGQHQQQENGEESEKRNVNTFDKLCILTGCPMNQSSRFQKFDWCQRHLNLYAADNGNGNGPTTLYHLSSTLSSSMKLNFVHVDKAAKKSMHQIVVHKNNQNANGMKSIASMFQTQKQQKGSTPNKTETAVKTKTSSSTSSLKNKKTKEKKIEVITCWSKNKHYESKENHVLIDDRISLKDAWVKQGGIFIHHVNTKDTIQQMVNLGIIITSS